MNLSYKQRLSRKQKKARGIDRNVNLADVDNRILGKNPKG